MDKKTKTILLVVGLAVGAWIAYSWWSNRQSGTGGQLGTNLNSIAPELIGGSTGPNSGLTYNAGAINLYYTAPISQAATNTTTTTARNTVTGKTTHWKPTVPSVPHGVNPGGPMFTSGGFRQ